LAEHFGANPVLSLQPGDVRLPDSCLPAQLFVARWIVSMFCVGESASVGLLQTLAETVTQPCVGAVVRTLLRDELLHDRFGWALARLVIPQLQSNELDWLENTVRDTFLHYETLHTGHVRPDVIGIFGEQRSTRNVTSEGENYGTADQSQLCQAFYARIFKVILPGLENLGLPARRIWENRCGNP